MHCIEYGYTDVYATCTEIKSSGRVSKQLMKSPSSHGGGEVMAELPAKKVASPLYLGFDFSTQQVRPQLVYLYCVSTKIQSRRCKLQCNTTPFIMSPRVYIYNTG